MIKEGIINVNKPAGMTSHDVIYAVRRLTGIKRVGHTGTLDPNATGVLPVCIGHAARITDYTEPDIKEYVCTMQLGLSTDTEDIWGNVIEDRRAELSVTEEAIREALMRQTGILDQYPPKYSAVRVNGRRLYEYARDGRMIEVQPRRVYVESIEILDTDAASGTVRFRMRCGKGTYVRAVCRDAGDLLGCGACMSELTRTASGAFRIEDSVSLDRIKEMTGNASEDEINSLINDAGYPLTAFGKAIIKNTELSRYFVNGGHIRYSEVDMVRAPRFENELPPFEIREEYRRAYALYGHLSAARASEEPVFLGVAFHNDTYKKLVADKVFRTADEDI